MRVAGPVRTAAGKAAAKAVARAGVLQTELTGAARARVLTKLMRTARSGWQEAETATPMVVAGMAVLKAAWREVLRVAARGFQGTELALLVGRQDRSLSR